MKKLKETFSKNGLNYTLLKRNEVVALFGISGTYTSDFTHFEVVKIQHRVSEYGDREAIPSNEQFGRDGCGKVDKRGDLYTSRAINDYNEAIKYYEELTQVLNLIYTKAKTLQQLT